MTDDHRPVRDWREITPEQAQQIRARGRGSRSSSRVYRWVSTTARTAAKCASRAYPTRITERAPMNDHHRQSEEDSEDNTMSHRQPSTSAWGELVFVIVCLAVILAVIVGLAFWLS